MRDFGLRSVLLAFLLLPVLSTAAHSQCISIAGTGCGALGTPPGLTCVGSPTAGGNASFGLNGTLLQNPILLVGLCATPPLTVSRAGFCPISGGPCVVGLDPSLLIPVSGFLMFPNFFFPLPVPNDPALVGATVCAQEVGVATIFAFGMCTAVSAAVSITVLSERAGGGASPSPARRTSGGIAESARYAESAGYLFLAAAGSDLSSFVSRPSRWTFCAFS